MVGAAGCSYCLAIASDKAGEGEVWLSSQNRNYRYVYRARLIYRDSTTSVQCADDAHLRNRMGKGSIANLASAVTVAASSFDMQVTDPRPLLELVDQVRHPLSIHPPSLA